MKAASESENLRNKLVSLYENVRIFLFDILVHLFYFHSFAGSQSGELWSCSFNTSFKNNCFSRMNILIFFPGELQIFLRNNRWKLDRRDRMNQYRPAAFNE